MLVVAACQMTGHIQRRVQEARNYCSTLLFGSVRHSVSPGISRYKEVGVVVVVDAYSSVSHVHTHTHVQKHTHTHTCTKTHTRWSRGESNYGRDDKADGNVTTSVQSGTVSPDSLRRGLFQDIGNEDLCKLNVQFVVLRRSVVHENYELRAHPLDLVLAHTDRVLVAEAS